MNKNEFINWIEEKTNILLTTTPQKFIDDPETRAYLQGFLKAMDEIKLQVKDGKFDI